MSNPAPPQRSLASRLFDAIDVMATAVFAIEGAAAASRAGLDLLGVLTIGFIVALAGGILRDTLLGDLPPAAFGSPLRIVVSLVASGLTFAVLSVVDAFPTFVLTTLDAVGLALFAVTGAQKAVSRQANMWVVAALGAITATGGGLVRDVILNRTPYVLSQSVYGSAALVGATVTGLALKRDVDTRIALGAGFLAAFALRMLAVTFDWTLPRTHP